MYQFQQLKDAENGYHIVQQTSNSYTFQYSHNIVKDVINAGQLVCDAVNLNPFANSKQWYIPYLKKARKNLSG